MTSKQVIPMTVSFLSLVSQTPFSSILREPSLQDVLSADSIACLSRSSSSNSKSPSNYDALSDPTLALLFAELKNKTFQTIQGSQAISGEKERQFVLHANRALIRMGESTS